MNRTMTAQTTADRQRAAIRKFMAKRGLKTFPWCKAAGLSEGTLRAFLSGTSASLQSDTLERLAIAANSTIEEILSGEYQKRTVPVVGIVGAGARIFPIDDFMPGAGLEEIECPPGVDPSTTVALRIQGDSMEPAMQEGWHVYYNDRRDGGCMEYVNKLCVVKIMDGPTLLKVLKRGYTTDRFNLMSYNAKMIEDVQLEWCARIMFIKPA